MNIIKRIKYFIQRGKRGYSDRDLWNFSSYLCDIIPPAVRSYKKGLGCPADLYDDKAKNNECHKWDDILEEIAQGFEAINEITDCKMDWENNKLIGYMSKYNPKKNLQLTKKYERGMDLFKKYFMGLWD